MGLVTTAIATLKDEIDNDPTNQGYKTSGTWKKSGLIEVLINAKIIDSDKTSKKVVMRDVISYLMKNGKWKGIKDSTSEAGMMTSDILNNPNFSTIDLSDTSVQAQLDVLVDEGTLTGTNKSELVALSTISVSHPSRAEEIIGIGSRITFNDIEKAKGA